MFTHKLSNDKNKTVSYVKSAITKDGRIEKIQKDFVSNSKKHINRPKKVKGITNTKEKTVHYFNPEITLTKDILDQTGKVLYKKGTKVNPLNFQAFTRQLLFIDGDNPQQVAFAISKHRKIGDNLKIILIKGSPIELMKRNKNVRFYFDQEGYLTKTFGIETVPSLVKKEGNLMKIEGIVLGGV